MRLLNADGSPSEISGNGLRCLAAWLAHTGATRRDRRDTDAGRKRLQLLERSANRYTFRAAMGEPERDRAASGSRRRRRGRGDHAAGRQPAVRRARRGHASSGCTRWPRRWPSIRGFRRARTSSSPRSRRPTRPDPDLGTRRRPDRSVRHRRLRGGGRGDRYGGAAREVDVESPGGTQRVEWRSDGLYLTGWAEIVAEVDWLGPSTSGPVGPPDNRSQYLPSFRSSSATQQPATSVSGGGGSRGRRARRSPGPRR